MKPWAKITLLILFILVPLSLTIPHITGEVFQDHDLGLIMGFFINVVFGTAFGIIVARRYF